MVDKSTSIPCIFHGEGGGATTLQVKAKNATILDGENFGAIRMLH